MDTIVQRVPHRLPLGIIPMLCVALPLGIFSTLCVSWTAAVLAFEPHTYTTQSIAGGKQDRSGYRDWFAVLKSNGSHRYCIQRVPNFANYLGNPLWQYANDLGVPKSERHTSAMTWGRLATFRAQPFTTPGTTSQLEAAYGWPNLCLHWTASRGITPTAPGKNWRLNDAIDLSPDTRSKSIANIRAIPLRPIWPGLIINSLFYAALWCLLFTAAHHIRRRFRVKHYCCPHCNYDLRNLPTTTCPECGTTAGCKPAIP